MNRRARWLAVAALLAVVLAISIGSVDQRQLTRTTFGRVPGGYAAVYELLSELGMPVTRSLQAATELDHDRPIWWIDAALACDEATGLGPSAWALFDWVRNGGTAVVIAPPSFESPCTGVADHPLPRRTGSARTPVDSDRIGEGPLLQSSYRLAPADLLTFVDAGRWTVVARIGADPFVLERRLGAGLVVVVADARVLRNRWLAELDNAPFALALATAYGVPRFDAHAHGFRLHASPVAYLVRSPALLVFVGLFLVALAHVWRSRLVPVRSLASSGADGGDLATYVDSLAALLAANPRQDQAVEAYRRIVESAIRRALHVSSSVSTDELADRLRAPGCGTAAALDLLTGRARGSRLRDAALQLDQLAWEATQ